MPLAVGTDVPAFTVKDTSGETVSLSDFAGKTVVLYFYPKDDTQAAPNKPVASGCQLIIRADIVVLGVSADDQASPAIHPEVRSEFSATG